MRKARFKPEGIPAYYHLYNQVAGEPGYFPFKEEEKARFIGLIHKLSRFYTLEVLGVQVMSNHFHVVLYAPAEPPSLEEAAARFEAYYQGKKSLDPNSAHCKVIAGRMRDISWFMHDLQQQFTTWFNGSREQRRRGSLWADRFKDTLLEGSKALWDALKYIEMNATKACMVRHPSAYRFGSYGIWKQTGTHPFQENIEKRLLPILQTLYGGFEDMDALDEAFREAFDEAIEQMRRGDTTECPISEGPIPVLHRKVRYWTDGGIVGCEGYVRMMIEKSAGRFRLDRLVRANAEEHGAVLYASRRLRAN